MTVAPILPAILQKLREPETFVDVAHLSMPSAVRHSLSRSQIVFELRDALRSGRISDSTLKEFVADCLREFRPDEQFAHDFALAAICIAVQNRVSPFSEQFLYELAKLKLAEMTISIRVARECLKYRVATNTSRRTFQLMYGGESIASQVAEQHPKMIAHNLRVEAANDPPVTYEIWNA